MQVNLNETRSELIYVESFNCTAVLQDVGNSWHGQVSIKSLTSWREFKRMFAFDRACEGLRGLPMTVLAIDGIFAARNLKKDRCTHHFSNISLLNPF